MTDPEFCVVCGRTGRALTDGLCPDCAADRKTLVSVPEHAEVVLCPTCGARLHGRHWDGTGKSSVLTAEDLAPFLVYDPETTLRTVRWEEVKTTATTRELLGAASVEFRGVARDVELRLSVRTVHRTCPACSRRSGRYYTAIVQLRGSGDSRAERARELRARLEVVWAAIVREARHDWKDACSWREELPEGWNCYFTETLAARSIARLARQKFGAKITESASLYGRKDGQDLYRVTFCLRFPPGVGASAGGAPVEP
ncbi:MAG TPA: 60S ribosomal export protein NMD3 [Thermoplasmata archaeon]|nr:60S ribosomal export protein NMD3 [Thermoplasmata archaeon]